MEKYPEFTWVLNNNNKKRIAKFECIESASKNNNIKKRKDKIPAWKKKKKTQKSNDLSLWLASRAL